MLTRKRKTKAESKEDKKATTEQKNKLKKNNTTNFLLSAVSLFLSLPFSAVSFSPPSPLLSLPPSPSF